MSKEEKSKKQQAVNRDSRVEHEDDKRELEDNAQENSNNTNTLKNSESKAKDSSQTVIPNNDQESHQNNNPEEIGGPKGPEPTRHGDWHIKGRVSDF